MEKIKFEKDDGSQAKNALFELAREGARRAGMN